MAIAKIVKSEEKQKSTIASLEAGQWFLFGCGTLAMKTDEKGYCVHDGSDYANSVGINTLVTPVEVTITVH